MTDEQIALIAEQMAHTLDLLRAEIDALRQEQAHYREFSGHRLASLEEQGRDHEQRLRQATDGVTQFKVWSGLAAGGSGFLSLAALLKAFLGG